MDTIENVFIVPPAFGQNMNFRGNPLWTVGEVQPIELRTNATSYSIALYQQSISGTMAYNRQTIWSAPVGGGSGQPTFNWTVDNYGNSLSFSPVFFLSMEDDGNTWPSHYFNISLAATATAGTASIVTVTETDTPPSANTAAAATSTGTSNGTQESSSSSTSTLAIGLGVALGVLALLMVVAGTWICLRRRKDKKATPTPSVEHIVPPATKHESDYRHQHYPAPAYKPPMHEVEGYVVPAELDRNHSPVEIGGFTR